MMEEDKSSDLQEHSAGEIGHEHISTLLKRRREEKGLTLQETAAATHVPVYYLQHLEGGGDPHLLADELYLIPFLRTYAIFLDLDPAYAVAEFVIASHRGEVAAGMAQETSRRPLLRRLVFFLILAGGLGLLLLWLSGWQG
jgi:cytoskeletal protein RodZ